MKSPDGICQILGHTWVIRRVNGRLVEICSTCKTKPKEA